MFVFCLCSFVVLRIRYRGVGWCGLATSFGKKKKLDKKKINKSLDKKEKKEDEKKQVTRFHKLASFNLLIGKNWSFYQKDTPM